MTHVRPVYCSLFLTFMMCACGDPDPTPDAGLLDATPLDGSGDAEPDAEPDAPDASMVTNVLAIDAEGILEVDRSLLGQPLLLSTAAATGPSIDDIELFKPRVVMLSETSEGLLLRELANGALVEGSDDRLLFTFPIVSSDASTIQANFMGGASQLYILPSIFVPGFDEVVIPFDTSTLESVSSVNNTVVVRSHITAFGGAVVADVVVGLSPYEANGGFDAREQAATPAHYVTWPVSRDGADRMFIHRFDVREEVVFHYTANTPLARVTDLQTSVDAWNAAFMAAIGSRPLVLRPLSTDVNPLDPDVSVVAWFESPTAGTGRGLNQSDPYTGELRKSLVAVTSVFGVVARSETLALVQMARQNAGMPPVDPTDAQLERVVSAYYVNTYVHELGHALGFRHNFAASLAGAVSPADTLARTMAYVVDGTVPSDALASSVLEYVSIPHVFTTGARVAAGQALGQHDMSLLYSAYGDASSADFQLYCEKETEDAWADCTEFDVGGFPIRGAYQAWEDQIDRTRFDIARTIANGDTPHPANIEALILMDGLKLLSARLSDDAMFLSVAADVDPEDAPPFRAAMRATQAAEYDLLAGSNHALLVAIVSGSDVNPAVGALMTNLRNDVETTLTWLGATWDTAVLTAWLAEVETEVHTAAVALQAVTYAPLGG